MNTPENEQGPGGVPLSRQRRPGLDVTTVPDVTLPANLVTIEGRLSRERMGPYRAAVGGGLANALSLYEWNAEIAGAWWSVIGDLEVLMRNAMHEQLTAWSIRTHAEPRWYLDPGRVFSEEARRVIAQARRQARAAGARETPGKVVAELSFGFWRFLLASRYERSLWRVSLYRAWPGQGLRREAHDAVHGIHGLRNRIAHHEPVHGRPLRALHETALKAAAWICPVTAEWIGRRSRVPELLARRPQANIRLGSPNSRREIRQA